MDGDVDQVARRLAESPDLAAASSHVGATRRDSSTFFFADIAHYFYAGDTGSSYGRGGIPDVTSPPSW